MAETAGHPPPITDELVSVQKQGQATQSYAYDRDGNRATQTAGGVSFTYAYDRTDELVSVQKGQGAAQSFAYDSRGNLTGDAETGAAVTSYAYDLGNRLTGIDASGTANDAAYAYDALGRIAARTVGAPPDAIPATDTYSYAGASSEAVRIATAQQGQGAVNLDSAVGPSGGRLAAASGSTYNWLLPDLHGSAAGSLSADQSTVTSATRYDAWGDTIATGAAGGTPVGNTAWKYQGRLDISPSGLGTPLYAMGARLYDPGVGAFTSLDTAAGSAQAPLSMNRFLYAQADPATLVDRTGHTAILENEQGTVLLRLGSAAPPRRVWRGQRLDAVTAAATSRDNVHGYAANRRLKAALKADAVPQAAVGRILAGHMRDRQADADWQSSRVGQGAWMNACLAAPPNPSSWCMAPASGSGAVQDPTGGVVDATKDTAGRAAKNLDADSRAMMDKALTAGQGTEDASIGGAIGLSDTSKDFTRFARGLWVIGYSIELADSLNTELAEGNAKGRPLWLQLLRAGGRSAAQAVGSTAGGIAGGTAGGLTGGAVTGGTGGEFVGSFIGSFFGAVAGGDAGDKQFSSWFGE